MGSECSTPVLLGRIRAAGGSVTTNGQRLRVRWFNGRPPAGLLGELQIRHQEIFRYLMGEQEGLLL